MAQQAQYTTTEAAFVLRQPPKTLRKALDVGPIESKVLKRAGNLVRMIGWTDLVYLFAIRELRDDLSPSARTKFYQALKDSPIERGDVRFGRFRLEVADIFAEVERQTTKLAELAGKVEFRADGEPILQGTDIEVYRVAALLAGGMSVDEVVEDYPSLNPEAVAIARSYADAYPKTGRPYPRKTVKRALAGAGLEALDEH